MFCHKLCHSLMSTEKSLCKNKVKIKCNIVLRLLDRNLCRPKTLSISVGLDPNRSGIGLAVVQLF